MYRAKFSVMRKQSSLSESGSFRQKKRGSFWLPQELQFLLLQRRAANAGVGSIQRVADHAGLVGVETTVSRRTSLNRKTRNGVDVVDCTCRRTTLGREGVARLGVGSNGEVLVD